MTYLEAVNAVLTRLRESTVGSVSQTTYSSLVGAFVNDAKRIVEDSWQWGEILTTVSPTVLTGARTAVAPNGFDTLNERARIYISPVTNKPLVRITSPTSFYGTKLVSADLSIDYASRLGFTNQVPSTYYFDKLNTSAAAGFSKLRLVFASPMDVSYTFEVYVVNPQNDLTSDSTVIDVPGPPIVQLAYLYCLYERGEELGEQLTMTEKKADQALADAIALDQASHLNELTFQVY